MRERQQKKWTWTQEDAVLQAPSLKIRRSQDFIPPENIKAMPVGLQWAGKGRPPKLEDSVVAKPAHGPGPTHIITAQ